MSPDFGDTMPDSGQTGRSDRISGYIAGIWPVRRRSDGILDGSSRSGQDAGRRGRIRPERRITGQEGRVPAVLFRIPAKIAGFRQLCQNLYMPNIKKYFYIIFY